MSDLSSEPNKLDSAVARAVRFGFAAMVLGLSYPNIQCARRLNNFEQIFSEMTGDMPLPEISSFVFHAQPMLFAVSIIIPIMAITIIFWTRLAHSIYISGTLVLLTFLQLFLMWHAVSEAWIGMIRDVVG